MIPTTISRIWVRIILIFGIRFFIFSLRSFLHSPSFVQSRLDRVQHNTDHDDHSAKADCSRAGIAKSRHTHFTGERHAIHIGRDNICCIKRSALGHCFHDIKHLQGVDRAEDRDNARNGCNHRQNDREECPQRCSAVHLRRFIQIPGDALQTGQPVDHVGSAILPGRDQDNR